MATLKDWGGPHREPEAMTRRAQWYLCIGGSRHAVLGWFAIVKADQFTSGVWVPIISYAPLCFWGGAMLLVALLMFVSAGCRSAKLARLALVLSGTLTLTVGAGILIGLIGIWTDGNPATTATPVLPTLLLSLALKDYAVCTQPLRSPFESILRSVKWESRHPRMPL